MQIIPEPYTNSKYPIRRLLWWRKTLSDAIWVQVYSEPLQVSKMECFAQTDNGLNSFMCTQKHFILDVWKSSEHVSAKKQGRCKVPKKSPQRR